MLFTALQKQQGLTQKFSLQLLLTFAFRTVLTNCSCNLFHQDNSVKPPIYVPGVADNLTVLLPEFSTMTRNDMFHLFQHLFKLRCKTPLNAEQLNSFHVSTVLKRLAQAGHCVIFNSQQFVQFLVLLSPTSRLENLKNLFSSICRVPIPRINSN